MHDDGVREDALGFRCEGASLWGIVSRPPEGVAAQPTSVLIVVGGPQYRVGSHRQFTLLARRLAARGFTTLRFDYRGMGDSEGDMRSFEDVGADVHAAVDALLSAAPSARQVVVWGLCDAASAALMHAGQHPRVSGIVAANPWARSDASLAAARVRYYYLSRLMQREFWTKLLGGGMDLRRALGGFFGNVKQARSAGGGADRRPDDAFQVRMARGLAAFRGKLLLIISGNDITAKEFLQHTEGSRAWKGLLEAPKVSRVDVRDADHTFSSRAWRTQVEDATLAWLLNTSR
ncbi:MAG TPA: hydrolase 1, exosortase A system-associated [Albitalea sp.]|uniref:hydrolase 1, exosortase A system-associated n=1 Tax=Piscinibacter sp. TaxID=1903157 RepID=UPI002ED5C873